MMLDDGTIDWQRYRNHLSGALDLVRVYQDMCAKQGWTPTALGENWLTVMQDRMTITSRQAAIVAVSTALALFHKPETKK